MHVLSVQRGNKLPLVLNIHTSDGDDAASIAERIARAGMVKVVLHSLDPKSGILSPVKVWNGRKAVSIDTPAAIAIPSVRVDDPAIADSIEPGAIFDQVQTYNGYCMKCHEKRDFYGEVRELANGSRAAQGTCPVCGTGMFRMIGKGQAIAAAPIQDRSDEEISALAEAQSQQAQEENWQPVGTGAPDFSSEEDEGAAAAAEVTAEVAANAAEIVQAAVGKAAESAVAAVQFSAGETAPVVAEAKPRKRAPRKAKAKDPQPAIPAAVEAFQNLAVCPGCKERTPVKHRAGLWIVLAHPYGPRTQCLGSLATVDEADVERHGELVEA